MEIFSIVFLFVFLPVALGVYWVTTAKYRNIVLAFFSLLSLFSYGEWQGVALLGSLVVDFFCAPYLVKLTRSNFRWLLLIGLTLKNLFIMYLLYDFEGYTRSLTYFVPLVFLLAAINYLQNVYLGNMEPSENFLNLFLYTCFFGKLQAGPIADIEYMSSIRCPKFSWKNTGDGFVLIAHGFGKKILLADNILVLIVDVHKLIDYNITFLSVLFYVFMGVLYAYFVLSGYCDVARGIGLLFGLDTPPSFKYPFASVSIGDFLQKFNSTVSKAVRQMVYTLMRQNITNSVLSGLSIILTLVLMGMWYRIDFPLVVWGAVLGIVVILENALEERVLKYIPRCIRTVFTAVVIILSFSFFTARDTASSVRYLSVLLGVGQVPLYDNDIVYIILSNAPLVIISLIFASNTISYIGRLLTSRKMLALDIATTVLNAVVLCTSVVFLVAS